MSLSAGQILQDRYRIEKLLGQGGMGAVYRAWDMHLNVPVAIKENLDASPEAQKQFEHEAQILARLSHPHLPRVTDHFFIAGQGQYLVMDFVEGEDLGAMLHRLGALPEPQVLTWIIQICDALAYLHSQPSPIVHRDIKPDNIRIRTDGKAMLVDFGIAKVYDPRLATTVGAKAVTPGYSPPEQYGMGRTDARSDIYALGATLYHLLTGQIPPESVQRLVGQGQMPPPRQLNQQISPVVEQVILRAVEVTTEKRFQTMEELRRALTQPLVMDSHQPEQNKTTAKPRLSRYILPIGAAIVVVMLIVGSVLTGIWRGSPKTTAPYEGTPTSDVSLAETQSVLYTTLEVTATPALASTATPAPKPTSTSMPRPTATPFGGGGRIAFVSSRDGNEEIYVMNTDGSGLTNLTQHAASDSIPAWSPDGRRIAFESNRDGNWEIYVMDADGSNVTRLTNSVANERDPDWSPDGKYMVFHSDQQGFFGLWVMNLETGTTTSLTDNVDGDWAASWSPDGAQIAFASRRDVPGAGEIYVMTATGDNPTNLTGNSAHDSVPHWSPDGTRIAFYSERDGNREIYVMRADGTGETRLTDHPANDFLATWSPDGMAIVFTSERDDNQEVYVMYADGSQVVRLTDNPAADWNPVWSPN